MPVSIKNVVPHRSPGKAEIVPDINLSCSGPLPFRVFISQEVPLIWPAPGHFKDLPKDQQEILANRYKYQGIRLRSDIKDKTVPLTRQTLDIP